MTRTLNDNAHNFAEEALQNAEPLRLACHVLSGGGRVIDCGVKAEGGIAAGIALARLCLADAADVRVVPDTIGDMAWPYIQVTCDDPVPACLLSQYAGWQIVVGKYFAMGSRPMRAASGKEELFERLSYKEDPEHVVGVLETNKLPGDEVVGYIAERTGVAPDKTALFVAPTASQAGNLQVVARSVETALHKLFELGFDVTRIRSGWGTAPLPPVAPDDLTGIGRTNDAILYGARVVLWVTGDDESLAKIGPEVPSTASSCHGKPFLDVFEDAGRDFYQIDPHLFSPAEIVFQNLESGRVHRFGETAPALLQQSFGLTGA